MNRTIKLHTISIGLATGAVLFLWEQIPAIVELSSIFKSGALQIIIGALTSAVIYRLAIAFFISVSENHRLVRKLLLGNSYLEGTWVGYYVDEDKTAKYFVERFEQTLDKLIIKGVSHIETGLKKHITWTSKPVHIDTDNGSISYMYECNDGKADHHGEAVFNFTRKNKNKRTELLKGYSFDLNKGYRVDSVEMKISDKIDFDFSKALDEAVKVRSIHPL